MRVRRVRLSKNAREAGRRAKKYNDQIHAYVYNIDMELGRARVHGPKLAAKAIGEARLHCFAPLASPVKEESDDSKLESS